ncbi:MAG: hypothetical protein V7767_12435 [Leeuwenhoekiella sp.]
MKWFFFGIFICGMVSQTYAQRNNQGDYNRLGLQGKYVLFNIETDNFNTSVKEGFAAGFTTRGGFYNNFDLIFGIDLLQANLDITVESPESNAVKDIEYKIMGAQVNVLASYLILGEYLTIEVGPVFMLNSKMELQDKAYENYIVDGYTTLRTQDIQEISKFNLNAHVGVTAGLKSLRANLSYQYGLLNTLAGLNNENKNSTVAKARDFKGNLSIISAGIIFYL